MSEEKINHLDFDSENLSFPEIHVNEEDQENELADDPALEEVDHISFRSDALAFPEVLVSEEEQIRKVAICGMGALGMMYGNAIQEGLKDGELCFLMDEERKERHLKDVYKVNGKPCSFVIKTPDEYEGSADLVIVSTKYGALRDAALLIRPAVGPDTTIISVLNGISSEEILGEYFDYDHIIDCVAIGMDAMREGTELTYENFGRLQVGVRKESQKTRFEKLVRFFEEINMPHEICEDIKHAMWNKFMINVGINQTCMVYETTYSGALVPGPALDDMTAAMMEVVEVAEAENIALTKEDMDADMKILVNLNPDGYPSMRQDALAGRPTEVELFAGTVVRLAEKHGISVPVNEKFLKLIHEREK